MSKALELFMNLHVGHLRRSIVTYCAASSACEGQWLLSWQVLNQLQDGRIAVARSQKVLNVLCRLCHQERKRFGYRKKHASPSVVELASSTVKHMSRFVDLVGNRLYNYRYIYILIWYNLMHIQSIAQPYKSSFIQFFVQFTAPGLSWFGAMVGEQHSLQRRCQCLRESRWMGKCLRGPASPVISTCNGTSPIDNDHIISQYIIISS